MRKGRGGTRLSALQTCLAGAITLHWRTRASSGSAAPFCLLLLTVFLTMDLIRERGGETGRRRAQTGEGERWGMRHHTRWRRRGGGRPVGGARNRDPAGRAARGRLQTHEVVAPMVVLVVREAPRRARGTHQSPPQPRSDLGRGSSSVEAAVVASPLPLPIGVDVGITIWASDVEEVKTISH
jgi:hypothetical protein